MSSDPPELTRELLSLWQEQLAQKDAQIANLTSLLQDANGRLSEQQRLLERFVSSQADSSPQHVSSPPSQERASTPDVSPPAALHSEPLQEDEVPDVREHPNPSPPYGSDLVRQFESQEPLNETTPEVPEPARISMSYFGAPMVGMARAVTAAAASGVTLDEDVPDEPPVRFLAPPIKNASEIDPSDPPVETPRSSASFAGRPAFGAGIALPLRVVAPLAIVVVLAVAGGLWWNAAHNEHPRADIAAKPITGHAKLNTPVLSQTAPPASGSPDDSRLKTVPPATSSGPAPSEVPTQNDQSGPFLAHRTSTARQLPSDLSALNSALATAARDADLPRIQALLAQGAEVNARNAQGATALMVAARHGNLPVVEALPASGADVNAVNSAGWNALMLAARYDQLPVMSSLIKHGAHVNDVNDKGATALMLAAQQGYQDAITLLLANGADAGRRNNLGQTARDLAALKGYDEIARQLEQADSKK